ncbi:MAG TPA: hypothetical protein VFL51_15335 [Pseudolabrys sp.]|nr:hypothetical protein [Pseudolabrys sp.]
MFRSSNLWRSGLTIVVLGGLLGACSEYLDRRVTVASWSGDAVETDKATQIIDPWPPASANRRIVYNGQRMQSAAERYRDNKVTPPTGIGTSAAYAPAASQASSGGGNNTTPVGPTVTSTH